MRGSSGSGRTGSEKHRQHLEAPVKPSACVEPPSFRMIREPSIVLTRSRVRHLAAVEGDRHAVWASDEGVRRERRDDGPSAGHGSSRRAKRPRQDASWRSPIPAPDRGASRTTSKRVTTSMSRPHRRWTVSGRRHPRIAADRIGTPPAHPACGSASGRQRQPAVTEPRVRPYRRSRVRPGVLRYPIPWSFPP